ncbi:MAG: VPS10 domain-containing protein [Bacillota bacterium]
MSIRKAALHLLTLPLLGTASLAHAAAVDPSLFQQLQWRSVGPYRGGRVLAVAGDPTDARRFYFGSVNGGVWETNDAGRTWQPIFDQVNVGSIGAIAIAPSNPKVIYVGTGEADMRSDIAQGIGMFRSDDGGKSWHAIGLADTQQIGRIIVDPKNPNLVLVAALGHPYGPNAERGVFRSTDGGRHWTKTLYKDADTGAIDLAFEPGNPNVVYAAMWQTRRPPWNTYPPSYGPGSGLYKSTDGGRSWHQLTGHGLPANPGRIGLATSPAKPRRVYALIDSSDAAQAGLYRSDDNGATWRKTSSDKRITNRGWYFGEIDANPKNADQVWVNDTIIMRSDDGGANFIPLKGDPTGDDFHAMWIDPKNSDRRILGVDQGTLVTLNGGKTWSSWYNQPTGQFYHVTTDNRYPYRIYGAQQDSGAAAVPSRTDSHFDGITMTDFHEVTAGGESDEIAPDPQDPDIVYGGRVDRLDLKSGQVRSVDPTLAFPDNYRSTWTLPLTWSKREHALLFGNQRIWRTDNGGETWAPISPDLTRPEPGVPPNVDPVTAKDSSTTGPRKGVVYDIGPSPLKDGLIWAGTDDGLIWRTDDNGRHLVNVTPAQLTPWSKVGIIEPSHFDPNTAYAAIDRHRLEDQAPHILRTRDGGRTWQEIVNGLPNTGGPNSVNVVREDPVQRGLLFAGTERGLFVSFDDGDNWQPLQNGLPTTSVRDITIHGDDLVIATHGRGFYVLDDMMALRSLAALPANATRLYPIATAIRVNEPQFTGTPMPKDEPMGANPPFGAYIDYNLAARPSAPVTIRIFDANGALVNSFSSSDPVKPIDLSKLGYAPEWVVSPKPPAATPGAHRFIWDLHYAPPAAFKDDRSFNGLWAVPGRYTVELDVDGQALRQPLVIAPDPRISVTPAQFAAQLQLARQIEQSRVLAHSMLKDADAVKEKLKGQPQLLQQVDAVIGTAPPILGSSDAATLLGISDRLDTLADAVESADAPPSPDALRGYATLSAALNAIAQRWNALRAQLPQ